MMTTTTELTRLLTTVRILFNTPTYMDEVVEYS